MITTLVAPAARRGGTADAPSGEVPLARGLNAPSSGVRLARGLLHAHHPHPCSRARASNALTSQDARHDPDTPGNHAPTLFHRLPEEGHPRHCVTLCDKAGVSPVTLCHLLLYS
jgi:hypothetical protein